MTLPWDSGQTVTAGQSDPHLPLILIQSTNDTRPMRYNPATDRAISIDEIAAQCKAAILKADHDRQLDAIADLLFSARWEDDVLIAA